jgi:hypothetical protein
LRARTVPTEMRDGVSSATSRHTPEKPWHVRISRALLCSAATFAGEREARRIQEHA